MANRFSMLLCLSAAVLAVGCTPPAEFRVNRVEERKRELQALGEEGSFTPEQKTDIGTFLTAVFGTPDQPRLPAMIEELAPETPVLRRPMLAAAAGPVASDRDGTARGLYREHCVHCHGITGDGAGPTAAFLNPYPRDFRLGKFKYKSTPLGVPPTHDDLHRVLAEGVPGTAMPSFKRLPAEELGALIDYVRYLTLRGAVERELYMILTEDPDPGIDLIASAAQAAAAEEAVAAAEEAGEEPPFPPIFTAASALEEIVVPSAERWLEAEDSVVEPPAFPEGLKPGSAEREALLARGRELYFGLGACVSCHGPLALGDGQVNDFDDWTKNWMNELGIAPDDERKIAEFVALGALPPRNIIPRNLRLGGFRGGRRPVDLFLRIRNGIEGTPMPAAAAELTDDDLWCLVEYVRQLPLEAISTSMHAEELNERPPR